MSARIERIAIEGVRGILPRLEVELDGKSFLLRGDSGTGKSSIVQALRYALCGPTTGSGFAIPEEYFRHRLLPEAASPRVVVTLAKGGVVDTWATTTDETGAAFRDACVRANPFFRRDELQDLLTSAPGERFKYLKSFLDLQPVDALADGLAEKRKTLAAAGKVRKARLDEKIARAARMLGIAHGADEDVDLLAHARARAVTCGIVVTETGGWDELVAQCSAAASRAGSPEAAQRRRSLATSIDRASTLVPPDHPKTTLEPLLAAEVRLRGGDASELLGRALAHVESHADLGDCPVCQQPVIRDQLVGDLKARLSSLEEVRVAKANVESHANEWREFLDELEQMERDAGCHDSDPPPRLCGRSLLEELDRDAGASVASSILTRLERVRAGLAAEHDELRNVDRAAELSSLHAAVSALAEDWPELERLRAEHDRDERLQSAIGEVEKALKKARTTVFDQEVEAAETTFAEYYRRVHPDDDPSEVTAAPKLVINNRGGGTVSLAGVFLGASVGDPRFLYSDGHLDTVALCLFLALRRLRAARPGDPRIMVLDDVVLSIDFGHTERLLKLLRDEFGDHQIVIVSHNEYFIRQCKQYLQHAKRQDINRWTPEGGPRLVGYVTHVEELRRVLDETGSNEVLATALRPVLDDFAQEACVAFDVAVRSGRDRPLTLADHWGPLRKKLKELAKRKIVPDFAHLFDNIAEPSFFRNALGAHLNEWALSTSLKTIQQLVENILALIEGLQCTACAAIATPLTPDEPQPNLACRCPRGQAPQIKGVANGCQTNGSSGVEAS